MIKKQSGMTLIELAIGMMLGLALVASIGQLFSQSQKSFRIQKNLNDMTDDATFILEALAKGILLAGYDQTSATPFPVDDGSNMVVADVETIALQVNEFIRGDATDEKKQQLVYRFQLGSVIVDGVSITTACNAPHEDGCILDNFVGTSSLDGIENDFFTVRIYTKNDANNVPVLYSKAQKNLLPSYDAQPLISEVEKLEFRYGIQIKSYQNAPTPPLGTCNSPITTVDTEKRRPECDNFYYTTADKVTADNLWTNVFAVKIFLVMRSAEKNLTRNNKTGWQIDDTTTEYPAVDEGRIYKVFSKTIFLRAAS